MGRPVLHLRGQAIHYLGSLCNPSTFRCIYCQSSCFQWFLKMALALDLSLNVKFWAHWVRFYLHILVFCSTWFISSLQAQWALETKGHNPVPLWAECAADGSWGEWSGWSSFIMGRSVLLLRDSVFPLYSFLGVPGIYRIMCCQSSNFWWYMKMALPLNLFLGMIIFVHCVRFHFLALCVVLNMLDLIISGLISIRESESLGSCWAACMPDVM